MSNPVPNITPSAKREATETYLEDETMQLAHKAPARRAFGAGYDKGLDAAADKIRELIADAEHRANVVGLPVVWSLALETLATELEAGE